MKINKLFNIGLALAASLFCGIGAQAQSLSIGIRGGGNYSSLIGIDSTNFKTGVVGGLMLNYQSEGKWSYSADILYTQRGTTFERNFKTENQTEKFEYNYSFNYVEVPILFHYNFLSDSSKLKARVFVGPSLNVRVNAKNDIKYTKVVNYGDSTVTTNTAGDQNLAFIYTPLDFGAIAGIGATYEITDKISASLDIRASYGLLDIREYLSKSSKAVHNYNVGILVGVSYKLGK